MAKPMPELDPLPVGSAIAVLMPMRRPRLSSSGPPAGRTSSSGAGYLLRERQGERMGERQAGWQVGRLAAAPNKAAAVVAAAPEPAGSRDRGSSALTRIAWVDGCIALDDVAQGAAAVACAQATEGGQQKESMSIGGGGNAFQPHIATLDHLPDMHAQTLRSP
jgi:hypothetical protein